ncbi:MAG: hypothetical protein LBB79_00525 [Prevotellaceae bacterium]|jgi:hypothetical protein|nr:hypothetical protein [Prevotellaceae bacterium]
MYFVKTEETIRLSEILAGMILVFSLLFFTCVLFPAEGIRLSSHLTLTFPSVQDVFGVSNDNVRVAFTIDCSESGFSNFVSEPEQCEKSALPVKCTPEQIRALPVQPIEYPHGKEDALDNIMSELAALHSGSRELVRILHYGDSQLEADRVTMYLRSRLQQEFGGGGVGYVALNPQIPVNPTVKITMSPDWVCSVPAVKYERSAPLRVGHLLSSVKLPQKQRKAAWIKVERRAIKSYPTLKFSRVKLLLTNSHAPIFLEVKTPSKTIFANTIQPNAGLQRLSLSTQQSSEPLTLSFRGNGCPEVFGLALDNSVGVAVDNIPLRSSSGIDFVKVNAPLLEESYRLVGAKLIILQFGANVVPQVTENYSVYEDQLYRQLALIKQLSPKISILVAGVSDMARRRGGVLASYPNIEKIRNAQRQAAFRAGCAFWDTYEAMGGKNSIISWAYARPVLATKDFCHLSNDGATLLAELMYRSFAQDVRRYMAMRRAGNAVSLAENLASQ